MIMCAAVLGQTVSRTITSPKTIVNLCSPGKCMQNKPLYLEAFQGSSSEEDTLKFHYVVHCALDAVEEKGVITFWLCSARSCTSHTVCWHTVSAPRKTPAEVFDTYLGMLYPTADYKVYAYISNTRIKFMLVLDDTQKDEKMCMVSTCLHHST